MRREFPKAVKIAAFQRSAGHCEGCTAKLFAGGIFYDHRIPDAMGGDPVLSNCDVLCKVCHDAKTRQQDVPSIAKAKRREARNIGVKKPRTITRWRRFDGSVVTAPRER